METEVGNSVYVIAECGINHNGSHTLAVQMIRQAAECGVDAVKFQVFQPDFDGGKFKKYVLFSDTYRALKDLAEQYTLDFIVTAFDELSIQMCEELGVKYWKIPSGESCNEKYLTRMRRVEGEKFYISTGMQRWQDIVKVTDFYPKPYMLFHCVSEYPLDIDDANLNVVFNDNYGYSNHAMSDQIEIPIAAVALGATVLEIHFTLDRELPGPDHFMSYEPEDLKELIERVDNVSIALGDGVKRIMPGERKLLHVRNRYK